MRSLKSELAKLTDSIEFQVRKTHAPLSTQPYVLQWHVARKRSARKKRLAPQSSSSDGRHYIRAFICATGDLCRPLRAELVYGLWQTVLRIFHF